VIFFEAPQSETEMETVARAIRQPLLANMVEHGKTPFLTGERLAAIGFKIVIYPVSTLYAVTKAVEGLLADLKGTDTTMGCRDRMVAFPEFNELIGVAKARDLEKNFL